MDWIPLTSQEQLSEIVAQSEKTDSGGFIIFKHSTRCGISLSAKRQLERSWDVDASVQTYYLDLLNYRDISNSIADQFGIRHESPQLLFIQNGQCTYHESHHSIDSSQITALLNQ